MGRIIRVELSKGISKKLIAVTIKTNNKKGRKIGEISNVAQWVKEGDLVEVEIRDYETYRDSKEKTVQAGSVTIVQERYTKKIAYVKCPGPCQCYY